MAKRGITMTSLSIYVVLLSTMITLALLVSNNINDRMFDERGMVINITNADKLQYNLLNSAKESNKLSVYRDKLVFGNGDIYLCDRTAKVIYKNGAVLVDNLDKFTITPSNTTSGTKYVKLSITLNKYLNELQRDIIVCVEE